MLFQVKILEIEDGVESPKEVNTMEAETEQVLIEYLNLKFEGTIFEFTISEIVS